jgi:Kef-type K+ transport system membrane component KefB
MQDVYLGGIVATTSLVGKMGEVTFADGVRLVGQLLGSLVLVVLVAVLVTKYVLPRLVLDLNGREGSVKMLGLLAICFTGMKLTELLNVSGELGCFVAGVMISASQPSSRDRPIHDLIAAIGPVRDCFLAIFLASVGMHIYPTFLLSNGRLLIVLTVAVITMKYASSMMVWVLVWRSEDIPTGMGALVFFDKDFSSRGSVL